MRELSLDASDWKSAADFYEALAQALGSVDWHGRNPDAFLETMICYAKLKSVQPPYKLTIRNAHADLREYLVNFASWVREARKDRKENPEWGDDVDVSMVVE